MTYKTILERANGWIKDHKSLKNYDDCFNPPTKEDIRLSIDVANALEESNVCEPDFFILDGDFGISFEWNCKSDSYIYVEIRIEQDMIYLNAFNDRYKKVINMKAYMDNKPEWKEVLKQLKNITRTI